MVDPLDRPEFTKRIRTTPAQRAEMCGAIGASNAYRNEKVWTFLVADLLAHASEQQPFVNLLCGGQATVREPLDVWFEAQPLPPRQGTSGNSEGNTKVDLAFGQIVARGTTGAGIAYGPHRPDSWVCFAEAKCMSDCSGTVTYDPLRNQLTRVIENVLTFQADGQFPDHVFFTLITPRLFKEHPGARLYGYKMHEYEDRDRLLRDLELCRIPRRSSPPYLYPDLAERLKHLTLTWTTYEDLLAQQFGGDLDIVDRADKIGGLKSHLEGLVAALRPVSAS